MMERINEWLFGILAWIILNTVCVIINFNYYFEWSNDGKEWLNLTVSVLFIVYMVFFACRSYKTFICVLGGIYIVLGIAGYFIAKYLLIADGMIFPEIIFYTPYAGVLHLLRSYPLCWLFYTGFGAVLILIASIRYMKENSSLCKARRSGRRERE